MNADAATSTIDHGPYESEKQTCDTPLAEEVRALHDSGRTRSGDPEGLVSAIKLRHLTEACEAVGVELGAYDWQIARWLTTWEPATIQVIIGLIARASAADAAGLGKITADRDELRAAVISEINTANAAIASAGRLRDELAEANGKLDAIRMLQTWTNEDGQTIIFADDVAAVLGLRGDNGR